MPPHDTERDERNRADRRGTLRAVIYTRVSSDKSGRLRSPAEQEAYCRKQCERNGWHVIEVITDGSMSGSEYAKQERPNWQRVLTMIRNRELDVLVVWSSSRATRNVPEGIGMLEDMRNAKGTKRGTVLYSYDGRTYNPDDIHDLKRLRQNVIDDAAKSDQTSEDVTRALTNNAEVGRAHGRTPFGYVRTSSGEQTPHPTEGPLVIEAAQRLLAGESSLSVCAWLDTKAPMPQRYTKEGRAWGKPGWDMGRLKHMMCNPTYAGKRQFKGELYDAQWVALWDYATTEALMSLYSAPWRQQFRNNKNRRHHLLSGIAQCSVCEALLYAGTSSRGHRRTYRCRNGHVSVDGASLDAYVTAYLVEGIARGYKAIEVGPTPRQIDLESQAALVRDRLTGTRQAMREVVNPAALGPLAELAAEHEATLAELDAALTAERRQRKVRPTGSAVLAAADDPEVAFDAMTSEERGAVIRDQLSIVVHPATRHLGNAIIFYAERVTLNWLDGNAEAA